MHLTTAHVIQKLLPELVEMPREIDETSYYPIMYTTLGLLTYEVAGGGGLANVKTKK